MKCPKCGYDMGLRAQCLRCGYAVTSIVPIDPEKIEKEGEPRSSHRVVDPDNVRVSRGQSGSVFDDIFGGGLFGGIGSIFGSLFGMDLFGEEESTGYEYDPKYYDDFGNEIDLPDEFERESVEIDADQITEVPPEQNAHRGPFEHKASHKEKQDDKRAPHDFLHKKRRRRDRG